MQITAHQLVGFDLILRNLIPNNMYSTERTTIPSVENIVIQILKQTGAGPETVFETDNFAQLGNYLWGMMNVRVLIPVKVNLHTYFVRVDAVQENGCRVFTLKLVKRDKRNSCAFNEYKNILGGYFYEPEYQLPGYVKKYLASDQVASLLAFVNRFNNLKVSGYSTFNLKGEEK